MADSSTSWISVWDTVSSIFEKSNLPDISNLLEWYKTTDPLLSALWIFFVTAFVCWVLDIILDNLSQADRLWAITPVIYVWHFVLVGSLNDMTSPRLLLVAILVTLWAIRQNHAVFLQGTFSFTAGNQQRTEKKLFEDYRWEYVLKKGWIPKPVFPIFHIVFIALYENFQLLLMVLPIYAVYLSPDIPFNHVDYIATALCLAFLGFESVSDYQMRSFQTRKKKFNQGEDIPSDHEIEQGFVSTGLFSLSRHPAQCFEILVWFTIWLFACSVTGTWLNWYVVCPLSILILINMTMRLNESISKSKYPLYVEYQKTVKTRLLLWPHKPFCINN